MLYTDESELFKLIMLSLKDREQTYCMIPLYKTLKNVN